MEDIKKIREFFSKPLNELEKETKISISIPDNTSYVDFAKTVAKILIDDYGSRNFIPFIKTLEKELNIEIPIIYSNIEEAQENNSIDYIKLTDLIKSANNPKNLPIYYDSINGIVNIGGTGYDKGDLVRMFNSQPGQSLDIKTLFYKADQSPEETKNAIESMNSGIRVEIGKGYGNKPFVKYMKSMNEAQEKDPVDTITMDVPLFVRMLEYAREDAKDDMDLHDVTEKANLLGKERGILQMEDYNEIIGTTENTPIQEMIKSVLNGKGIKRKK